MDDQIVTFEVAKLAKEHGFNIPTSQFYNDDGTLNGCISLKDGGPFGIYAPSQTCICRWLRK